MSSNWESYDEGRSIGKTGSENGVIIYDIEHSAGARVTLEKIKSSHFATTLGVYGVMFHTRFDAHEKEAREFIEQTVSKIEELLALMDVPEDKQDADWRVRFNSLTAQIAEY